MRIEWTPRAQQYLQSIIDYYKPINPEAGLKIIDKIQEKSEFLATFPRMGRVGLIKGTFELVIPSTPYLLIYELLPDKETPDVVSIMAVFSSRQER